MPGTKGCKGNGMNTVWKMKKQQPLAPQCQRQEVSVSQKTTTSNIATISNSYNHAKSHPIKYTDPDGRIIETPWDFASAAFGYLSTILSVANGEYGNAAISFVGALADTAAGIFPGVPGGVSVAIKAVQYGATATGAIKNVAEGIIERDAVKVGIGVFEMVGMALGAKGSGYLKEASEIYARANLIPRSMVIGAIYAGLRAEHAGYLLKAMEMAGISADFIKASYDAYMNYQAEHSSEISVTPVQIDPGS
ncbi:hypothetical protein FACS1894130_00180 [Spirochaetia bacterium]|nr:hypothetical protein FACS1894130_00180 [Spirochaetia bacterium]